MVSVRHFSRVAHAHEQNGLDRGVWEALILARKLNAGLLLIDERTGARFAREQGYAVTGTPGIFVEAARLELVSIESARDQLSKRGFGAHPTFSPIRAIWFAV